MPALLDTLQDVPEDGTFAAEVSDKDTVEAPAEIHTTS